MTDTTTTDQRSPEEIERDIRATQEEMSRTVEQIGGELNARNILNSLLDKAEDGGIDARFFLDNARRNPIALGMIAIGGLWLVSDADARPAALGIRLGGSGRSDSEIESFGSTSGSSGRSSGSFWNRKPDGWHPDHRRYVEHMSACQPESGEDDETYRRRRDIARANYFMIEQGHDEDHSAFRQRLDAATQTARDSWTRAGEAWSKAGRGASRVASGTRERARGAASDVQDFYGDNPLLMGLGAAFIGAVVGAMLPATRTEEQYVGGLGEQALGAANAQVKKVGEAARQKKDELLTKVDDKVGASGQQQSGGQDMGGQETGDMSTARQGSGVGQQV
ncbi:DUF3618 domain-containing protein [Erythrobacter sp. NE805]|uniref:DUF3618 domain-containing protein n=1 Tax=Erythrobacter sp. NE805 TaxID=3389875 RepID=UPI00396B4008